MKNGRRSRPSSGFTLVEIAVVIVVAGLMAAMFIGVTASLLSQQRLQATRARLANVDTALTLFVSQYKRLPCPADGRLASADPNAGVENANVAFPQTEVAAAVTRACTGDQQYGVVPWRVLGLAAGDIEDAWGSRITYRVGPELVRDRAMDFANCDPAGTAGVNAAPYTGSTIAPAPPPYCRIASPAAADCSAANLANCTSPNAALIASVGKGLAVENIAGTILMDPRGTVASPVSTGAAYFLVSHAAEGGGGYDASGTLQSTTVASGTMEAMNFANRNYVLPPALPAAPTSFLVDDSYNGVGTNHFDDLVSRPSILAVAIRAQVGPRSR